MHASDSRKGLSCEMVIFPRQETAQSLAANIMMSELCLSLLIFFWQFVRLFDQCQLEAQSSGSPTRLLLASYPSTFFHAGEEKLPVHFFLTTENFECTMHAVMTRLHNVTYLW